MPIFRFHSVIHLTLIAIALAFGSVQSAELPLRNDQSPMGLNIGALVDWNTELPFIDVFRFARSFTDVHPGLKVDEHGWPTVLDKGQKAETFLVWDIGDVFPAGIYTVMFDGQGELRFGGGARVASKESGRYWVNVNPRQGGMHLKIERTDPDDPIRNIRVIMPGGVCRSAPLKRVESSAACAKEDYLAFDEHYEELVFNPDFLNLLADFKVLRFLDYLRANNSEVVEWADRGKLADATWSTDAGGPIELMVAMTNAVEADLWMTIPHKASDDYVRQLALYLKQNLHTDGKVYVEYSNEVWNGRFKQFRYMIERGQALNLGGDQYQAGIRFYSSRSVEMFKIFESVFGGTERLVRVIAGQAANAYIAESALKYNDAYKHTDAVAMAPYIGGYFGDPEGDADKLSLQELFRQLRKDAMTESVDWMKAHAQLAKRYDVDLVAYEGGHHLAGYNGSENNEKLNALFDKADKNPQMGSLYARYFDEWKKSGGQMFVYYKSVSRPSKWGRWGIADRLNTLEGESPKKDAVLEFIRDNPRWW